MEILKKIFEAGVVGAGGAGFPTYKKLVKGAQMLIVNAVECEPLLCSDRLVMRRHAAQIIDALIALRSELEIGSVVIGTKSKYGEEISALQGAVDERKADIRIHGLGSFYPAGDEQVLVYEITGKTVPPGGIPLALGIVVVNVTTVLNIHSALLGSPVTEKYITVTGEVTRPCIVRTPVGTPVADCIAAAGGASCEDYTVVMGGPMMGKRYGKADLKKLFVGKADGGVILLPAGRQDPTQTPLQHVVNLAKSACIQCAYCTQMCPRYLIGHNLRPHQVMRLIATGSDAEEMKEALLCCECGICELYACPMQILPRQVNIFVKNQLRERGIRDVPQTIDESFTQMRQYRRIAQSRIISRLDLTAYPTSLHETADCSPQQVSIALLHGVGKPATPLVAPGDAVETGDLIAGVEFGELGSCIHASISGTVRDVGDFITIQREG